MQIYLFGNEDGFEPTTEEDLIVREHFITALTKFVRKGKFGADPVGVRNIPDIDPDDDANSPFLQIKVEPKYQVDFPSTLTEADVRE